MCAWMTIVDSTAQHSTKAGFICVTIQNLFDKIMKMPCLQR